ncbi:MAG: hypothetical protein DRP42_06115, partial [Tenericutes bacterium]
MESFDTTEEEQVVPDFNDLGDRKRPGLSTAQSSKLAFYTTTTNPNGSGNPINDFSISKYNMEVEGKDAYVDSNIQRYLDEYNNIRSSQVSEIANAANIPPEQKAEIATKMSNNTLVVDPEQEFMIEQAASANIDYTSFDDVVLTNQIAHNLVYDRQKELREARDERSWPSGIGDIVLSSVIPFSYNEVLLDIAEELIPHRLTKEDDSLIYTDVKDGTIGYLTGPGDITTILRQEYAKLQGPDKVDYVSKLVDILDKNAGYFDNSLFTQEYVLSDVMQPFLNGEIDPESMGGWDIANNIFYGLDLLSIGQLARAGMRSGARLLDSPMAAMASSNPPAASELARMALNDDRLAKAMNMTKEELTEFLMPGVDPKGILNVGKLGDNAKTGQDIIDLAKNESFAYTTKEIEDSFPHFLDTIANNTKVTHSPNASTVVFDRGTGTNHYNAVYLDSKSKPFKTIEEATELGERIFPGNFEVKAWDRGADVITEITPKSSNFVINTKGAEQVNMSNMKHDILSLNDGNTFGSPMTRWISAPSGKLAKEVVGTAWVGLRKESIMNAKFVEMLKPFTKLKRSKTRGVVAEKWLQGSKEGKVYSEAQLVTEGFTPKMVQAYNAGIQVNNTQYIINNHKLYNRLNSEGYMNIVSPTKDYVNVAKTYTGSTKEIGTVFDPATDSIIKYSKDTMPNIAILKSKVKVNNESTIYALLGDATKLKPLTKTPLKFNEGYVPRHYDNLYFITQAPRNSVHNGKAINVTKDNLEQHGNVIHGVDSIDEANKLVAKLEAEHPDMVFSSVLDRNTFNDIQGVRFSEEEYQLHTARGNMHQRGRGAQLGETKFSGIGEATEEVDAVTAIMSSFHNLTRGASMGDMTNSMKQRWLNDYGHLTKDGKFPIHTKDIVARDTTIKQQVPAARAYFDYINTLEGYGGEFATTWRNWMIGLGEWMDGKGMHTLGGGIQRSGKVDPTKRIRGLAFNTMIAGNPLRQAAIQTMQFIQLAGIDPKVLLAGLPRVTAMRQTMALSKLDL